MKSILIIASVLVSQLIIASERYRVKAKWNFYETQAINCDDDKSNSPSTCVFVYKGKRYTRGESYVYDVSGHIDSVYSYRVPLGVNIYDMPTYGRYMMSLSSDEFKEMQNIVVMWVQGTGSVNDPTEENLVGTLDKNELQFIVIEGKNMIIYQLESR